MSPKSPHKVVHYLPTHSSAASRTMNVSFVVLFASNGRGEKLATVASFCVSSPTGFARIMREGVPRDAAKVAIIFFMSPIACYLKTHRRRLGLTQRELAALLGFSHEWNVCRYEQHTRTPDLEIACACQIIFGVPVEELFPGIYASVEDQVIRRAEELVVVLGARKSSPRRDHKIRSLNTLLTRRPSARR